jgi:hypothetical protein
MIVVNNNYEVEVGNGGAIFDYIASPPTPEYNIGDWLEGGRVGYIFVDGDYGYVAGQQHGIIYEKLYYFNGSGYINIGEGGAYPLPWGDEVLVGTDPYVNTINGLAAGAVGLSVLETDLILAGTTTRPNIASYVRTNWNVSGSTGWSMPTIGDMGKYWIVKDTLWPGGEHRNQTTNECSSTTAYKYRLNMGDSVCNTGKLETTWPCIAVKYF